MSSEIKVFLTALLPISELRGAIPLGFALNLSLPKIIIFSILGNLFPIPFILILLKPVSKKLRRFPLWRKFFEWLFKRTERKAKIVERWEFWGLVIFVGIPLPMTGAWTGAVAGSLLGMSFPKAMLAISLGVFLAALIVTGIILSGRVIII
ncbi:MAG: small multi-drug export protein [Candidatus Omnitrophica bacterium]|nr:small multi-drug export protein [Candidatus Omnitrophota bacterium]MCM8793871.1 small multi-drug export protein [Candidatus Omnitrophota bacterium]